MSEEQWTMDDVERWLETEKIASEVQARVMQRLDRVFLEIKVMAQLSEREACAKIADSMSDAARITAHNFKVLDSHMDGWRHEIRKQCLDELASAIRARGRTDDV